MPNLTYESMTRFLYGGFTIRVWKEESAESVRNPDPMFIGLLVGCKSNACPTDIAEIIIGSDGVAAVEVVDGEGDGTVIYKDWP